MNDSRLRILGIRCYHRQTNGEAKQREEAMQKALRDKKDWVFFYKGIREVEDDVFEISDTFFDDSIIFDTKDIKVSISAIAGKNGTGKSTILDMMLRVLNNLSASVIGEKVRYNAAEHLHFIDFVSASLLYYCDGEIKEIKVDDRDVNIYHYELNSGRYIKNRRKTERLLAKTNKVNRNLPLEYQDIEKLDGLFYTMYFNYSSYAYNYRDYWTEATPEDRIKEIDSNLLQSHHNSFWLTGLFHKNDGYQTPVVINPMRANGILDGVKENYLAKERLLSMMFFDEKVDNETVYPYRTINGNLKITGLSVRPFERVWSSKWRDKDKVCDALGFKPKWLIRVRFEEIKEAMIPIIRKVYVLNNNCNDSTHVAMDYIVYKILKISVNYKRWGKIFYNLRCTRIDWELFENHLRELRDDYTHVTVKLRRTISYLKSDTYPQDKSYGRFLFDDMDKEEYYQPKLEILRESLPEATRHDLLPPPVMDFDFIIEKPSDNGKSVSVYFEGLSSGERQIAYIVSNFIYHIVNINSAHHKIEHYQKNQTKVIKYEYINAVFDEIELYFHPELQRKFVSYLLSALSNTNLDHIKGVNIILVTHSPFILSDLPKTNVLKLWEKPGEEKETFCANIHDMLSQSFFLDYTVGQKAQEETQATVNFIRQCKTNKQLLHDESQMKRARYVASIVADEYVAATLKKGLDSLDSIDERIEKLQAEINKLRKQKESSLGNV